MLRDKADKISATGATVPAELLAQIAVASRAYAGIPEEPAGGPPKPETAREAMDKALRSVGAFKVGGAGATAARTLRTLVKNALESPGEPKFRSVNLTNERIRERLVGVSGSLAFLKAAGWAKDESGGAMVLTDAARDEGVLASALAAIDAAFAAGGPLA